MSDAGQSRPDGPAESPHELVNPDGLPPPVGFTHAVVPAAGTTVHLAGQTAHDAADRIVGGDDLVAQLRQACGNLRRALGGVGARPAHLVAVHLYTTRMDRYRASLEDIGVVWRETLGRHFPAMAVLEVTALVDPDALVELVAVAVIPEG